MFNEIIDYGKAEWSTFISKYDIGSRAKPNLFVMSINAILGAIEREKPDSLHSLTCYLYDPSNRENLYSRHNVKEDLVYSQELFEQIPFTLRYLIDRGDLGETITHSRNVKASMDW